MKRIILYVICIIMLLVSFGFAADKKATDSQICKACIGIVMSKSPSIIKIDKVSKGIVYLSYIRASDGTKWTNKCKVEKDRVLWGSEGGRWRDFPEDGVITYKIKGDKILIKETYQDGSSNEEEFSIKQLK